MLHRDALLADLRENAFGLGAAAGRERAPRIGVEVELIPVTVDGGAQVPIVAADGPATLPVLRRFGQAQGWTEEPSSYGVPRFVLPDGGTITYEPGGQIELSAAACTSASGLVHALRSTVVPLMGMMEDAGIRLLSVGMEPRGPMNAVPLQLPGGRYVRMTRFMEAIGTGGTRMMRQTAAVQVSLDFGADPLARWRVWNAMAPYVVAIFANSPVYGGASTGYRSYRAQVWRELDGGRTGTFPCADPVAEYLEFATRAPLIMTPGTGEAGAYRTFDDWNQAGCVGPDEWRLHLSTLFPEVRPKGFAEVRSADAVAPEWYAAPLVLLAGIAYHPPSLRAADDLLGAPDPALLSTAGRDGLSDPRIASVARDLADIALAGAAALPGFFSGDDTNEAATFFSLYTRRARAPADDTLDALAEAIAPR